MRVILLALTCLLASNAWAAEWPLVRKGSEILFTFTQMNVPVRGRFATFSGTIDFDVKHLDTSSVKMDVQVASVRIDDDADAEVLKPEWLSALKFPQATFISKKIQALSGGRYEASGTFRLKGFEREMVVPFTFKETSAGAAAVKGTFNIRRSDFSIGEGEWSAFDVVANDVTVKFHLLLDRSAAKPSTPSVHRS